MENEEMKRRREIVEQNESLKVDEYDMLARQIDKAVYERLKALAVKDGNWQINREVIDLLKNAELVPSVPAAEKSAIRLTKQTYSELVVLKSTRGYGSISDLLSVLINIKESSCLLSSGA